MNTFDKFKETHLPSYESFYSSKTDTNITRQDYKHAQKVWNKFKCKNIGDYHDFYVQPDTLLLADCFENFRNPCQKEYELDPCYFVSIPGLILKKTQVKLELLTDIDMILMNENGIRGGITQAVHRYSSANNKYMENYILNIPFSYLMYLDANNLYGYTMCRKLPLNDFRWVKNITKLSNEFIMNYDEETSKRGYLLEVDIEYPKHLHNEHLKSPFCPSKDEKPATNTKYSSSIQNTRKNNEEFLSKPNQKLLTTLYDKERYVVQITTLQQALKHGLKLKKIHRAKSFRHSYWLKPYIDLNTDLRSKAKNEFEKDFFKLMNSSVFGKMMVNVREHRNINLVDTEKKKKGKKLTSQPNFISSTIFSENLEEIEMRKTSVLMKKAIAVGQCILDKSKELRYEFWYDVMKPEYKDKIKLLYMDTDSFIMHIHTEDIFKDMNTIVHEWFDTSKYVKILNRPKEHDVNVIGKFKDQLNQ